MSLTDEFDLEQCLADLDVEIGTLPVQALRLAQANHEAVIPGLIRVIEDATADAREGKVPDTNGPFFAFYLLTEFRAREAWPALLAAMRLPGKLPLDLFGDIVHEVWASTVQTLANDRVDEVLELIRDREVNEYVRWGAIHGLTQMVAWNLRPRDEVVSWLRLLFHEAVVAGDLTISSAIVCELDDLWPGEAMDEIRDAFHRDQVDDTLIDLEYVERNFAAGLDAAMKTLIERRSEVTDTVAELEQWGSFADPDPTPPESLKAFDRPAYSPTPLFDAVPAGTRYEETAGTIHNETRRVGRNEPCPCGSGKKFKKCCGQLS